MQAQSVHHGKVILVDGSGYIFRAYHALPPLTRPDGTPVGAVMGFTNMLLKLREEVKDAAYLAVIFDVSRKTFRQDIYPEYKANRPPPPEDLIPQFALVRDATRALNIPVVELDQVEADDLIASYATHALTKGLEVMIVSSDKDLMQLIEDGVSLYDPMKQKAIGLDVVMEKFGVSPDKMIEVQALIGDSVDNVPGVPGIGPKTAAQLINHFGSLERLLSNTDQIPQIKRRELIEQHAQQARISYELVQLKRDVELPVPLDELAVAPIEPSALHAFLTENNFKSLLKRVGGNVPSPTATTPIVAAPSEWKSNYVLVQDVETLKCWILRAKEKGVVAIDTETTGLDATQAGLVGISLALGAGDACYIPLGHVTSPHPNPLPEGEGMSAFSAREKGGTSRDEGQADLFGSPAPAPAISLAVGQLPASQALELLAPIFADSSVLKIGQNLKYDAQILIQAGVPIHPIADTMLCSYVLAAGAHAHNLDELSQLYLSHTPIAFKDVVGSGKNQIGFEQVELERARDYAAEDADIAFRLYDILKQKLVSEKLLSVYEEIERPLVPVIVAMEQRGIKVNPKFLQQLSDEFLIQMDALEKEIIALVGHPFNLASPKQLGEILFDEMQLPGGKKSSKSGAYSTDAGVLEDLAAAGHALPQKLLDWRSLAKLKSTYTDALIKQINPKTGRIHTSYSMAATTTGRLSSSDPNLQNIPIRTHEGKRIREAFIAEEGYQLISADYSQIELRLLAHVADIGVLKEAFKNGIDIHAVTASQMFGVPVAEVSGELRRRAKTINFGIIYGISAHGLATRLGIGRGEAADYIEAYFKQYPGIKDYMEHTKSIAREQGYVETIFGRRIHLKDIASSNGNLRAFSERAAINAPLQGSAADIIKLAMIDVQRILIASQPDTNMLLQVHDELVLESPASKAKDVAAMVAKTMQAAANLSVPLLVETGIGSNWGEIH